LKKSKRRRVDNRQYVVNRGGIKLGHTDKGGNTDGNHGWGDYKRAAGNIELWGGGNGEAGGNRAKPSKESKRDSDVSRRERGRETKRWILTPKGEGGKRHRQNGRGTRK